ncbi:MAG TPA: hypothetical protein DEF43_14945 [Chloroflexus aurantiacus]|uniref:CRISPR-associated protein Cas5 n=1 Tax=Chloroflexus aurantiacus (strain ATCC 29366 / DSM 635 / J-10-fl) TaxID=324602 RepID=A9WBB3_CHLAA|nr:MULTISPECIES: hypothetical protein [Chloroflexus]ABY33320.1 conserved hypothetical protein [Chloroflexus aurantiacus J-10-fl]GIV93021.1 MAG: hypothetical protein KatS3mg056_1730 [Chloroflexus sp.]HBW68419.1 hypothetical protein [Chloroflexus aurantiacus]
MWLIAEYEAVSLFSLRPSFTTASGGKTLLAPTPFAIKMAIFDALCRAQSLDVARSHWPAIARLEVALRPAAQAVVSNVFQRVLRPSRSEAKPNDPDFEGFFQRTIGYREYVHLFGDFAIGLGWEGSDQRDWLRDALLHITYLGKRGGFVQVLSVPAYNEVLPAEFVSLTRPETNFPLDGTMQVVDDCAPNLSFEKIDVYNPAKKLSKGDRTERHVVLPYRLKRSSKSFSWYERV